MSGLYTGMVPVDAHREELAQQAAQAVDARTLQTRTDRLGADALYPGYPPNMQQPVGFPETEETQDVSDGA